MSTNIIVITQKHVGTALVKAAKNIFGQLPLPVITVAVNYRAKPEILINKLIQLTDKLKEDGIELLILTDLYGSTSSNIANMLSTKCKQPVKLVAGLNLPMLVKVLSNPKLSLNELAKKALAGGRQGIIDCQLFNNNQQATSER
jgi:mannose PTS system EIIA component